MRRIMQKMRLLTFSMIMILMGAAVISVPVLACEFSFNYERIEAPVGTEGKIGVQVEKTHARCTMEDTLDYQFDWEHIQILGETDWEETTSEVYQKWFWVSLSSPGEGFLKISKTCSKEGYEEAVLPVIVTKGEETGIWKSALEGKLSYSSYPWELETETENILGKIYLEKDILKIENLEMKLPILLPELVDYQESSRIYYIISDKKSVPLLIVSDDFYLRFDQYQNS